MPTNLTKNTVTISNQSSSAYGFDDSSVDFDSSLVGFNGDISSAATKNSVTAVNLSKS